MFLAALYHENREITIKLSLNFIEKGTKPASKPPNSDPPGNLLPSAEAAARSSDRPYRNLREESCVKIPRCPAPAGRCNSEAGAAGEGDRAFPAAGAKALAGTGYDPEPAGGCKSRRSGVHIGYTSYHLPKRLVRPPCPRNPEAIRAIFAARMARSSFSTFRPLKYGFSARSRVC